MSAKHWPAVAPFDPATGLLPAPLEALWSRTEDSGHLLILATGSSEWREGWAARAAIALATARAAQGVQVLLADLGAESPTLHRELGEENLEGVADIFQFGASLRRVARVVPGHGILFLPTGAYVPDPAELLAAPIWEQLLAQLEEEHTCLLAFLPVETPGADQLARHFDSVVVLSEQTEGDVALGLAGDSSHDFVFVLHPPVEAQPDSLASTVAAPDVHMDPVEESLVEFELDPIDDLQPAELELQLVNDIAAPGLDPQPVDGVAAHELDLDSIDAMSAPSIVPDPAVTVPQPVAEPDPAMVAAETVVESAAVLVPVEEDEDPLHEPPPLPRAPRRRRGVSPVLWLLLLIAGAVGGWTLLDERDLLPEWARLPERQAPGQETAPTQREEVAVKAAGPISAEPIETPLPYSVAVEAHQDYATAEERVLTLRRSQPALSFYLSPIIEKGVVYHRVLAGPVADTATAWKLMERLVAARLKTDLDAWSIRPTVWAYQLGDFESRGDADARMEELRAQQIPTYLVEVEYTAGPPRYRIYVGAFEGPAPAEILAPRLKEAGLDLPLVRRYGKPIQ